MSSTVPLFSAAQLQPATRKAREAVRVAVRLLGSENCAVLRHGVERQKERQRRKPLELRWWRRNVFGEDGQKLKGQYEKCSLALGRERIDPADVLHESFHALWDYCVQTWLDGRSRKEEIIVARNHFAAHFSRRLREAGLTERRRLQYYRDHIRIFCKVKEPSLAQLDRRLRFEDRVQECFVSSLPFRYLRDHLDEYVTEALVARVMPSEVDDQMNCEVLERRDARLFTWTGAFLETLRQGGSPGELLATARILSPHP